MCRTSFACPKKTSDTGDGGSRAVLTHGPAWGSKCMVVVVVVREEDPPGHGNLYKWVRPGTVCFAHGPLSLPLDAVKTALGGKAKA